MKVTTLAFVAAFVVAATSGCTSNTTAPAPSSAAQAPCGWVTADEAAAVLGGSVTATPRGDHAGSAETSCGYSRGPGENGLTSELRLSGALSADAASEFAATGAGGEHVDGIGQDTRCVFEPTTTPPSTTLVVLLSGDRIYRVTGWYGLSCEQLEQTARKALERIGA